MKRLNIKQSIAALLLVVPSFLLSATPPPHFTPSFALQDLSYQDERVLFLIHTTALKRKSQNHH